MDDTRRDRILSAYKLFFGEKFKSEVNGILLSSKSLAEADERLNAAIDSFDAAWEEIKQFYHVEDDEQPED